MTTLADVARAAGVSTMTVSNVLAGRAGKVSERTAERVRAAIEETGYVPSAAARSLSVRRSRMIALVVNGDGDVMTSTHDARYVGELSRVLQARGYVSLLVTAVDLTETTCSLRTWNVDGAIFVNTMAAQIESLLDSHSIPMLFSDNYSEHPGVLTVRLDDAEGGAIAARRLIQDGHRRTLFLGPLRGSASVDDERWRGFRAEFLARGLPEPTAADFVRSTTVESGAAVAEQVLALSPRPTAVFCSADDLAAGLLQGLRARGVEVPRDISVIGYDGFDVGRVTVPELTTIAQDITAKAERSVDVLLGALGGGEIVENGPLPVRLLERASVGAAPV